MRLPAAALVLAVLAGCGQAPKDPLIARVGPLTITKGEYHQRLAEVAPEYQNYVVTPNGRKQFLEILMREKLMLAASADEGIPKLKEYKDEIEKLREEQRQRLREFEDYLKIKLWRDRLKDSGTINVSPAEVRAYWEKHPTEVQLAHILLANVDEGEVLLRKARKGGSFAALAKTNSLDQDTAQSGGRLKPLLYGEVLPELEDVAFRMKVGEVTGLIRSKFGYHILKKESEHKIPFEAARERIEKLLEKQKLDAQLEKLQGRYPMEVVDAEFK